MNWARIVLDGLAMCVVFNVSTALLWTIRPMMETGYNQAKSGEGLPYADVIYDIDAEGQNCGRTYHSFGFNRKEQLTRIILFPFVSMLLVWICTLL
ncbi:MAG TPA: hypothetical protein H9996_07090 [Candidatus Faecalibacterium avium]|nr:hypothetical protein [Candidatus Faecalibacterium avium]